MQALDDADNENEEPAAKRARLEREARDNERREKAEADRHRRLQGYKVTKEKADLATLVAWRRTCADCNLERQLLPDFEETDRTRKRMVCSDVGRVCHKESAADKCSELRDVRARSSALCNLRRLSLRTLRTGRHDGNGSTTDESDAAKASTQRQEMDDRARINKLFNEAFDFVKKHCVCDLSDEARRDLIDGTTSKQILPSLKLASVHHTLIRLYGCYERSPPWLFLQKVKVGAVYLQADATLELVEGKQQLPQSLYYLDISAETDGKWNANGSVRASKWGRAVGANVDKDLLLQNDAHRYQQCDGFVRRANNSGKGSQSYRLAHISPPIIARSLDPIRESEYISLAEAQRSLGREFLAGRVEAINTSGLSDEEVGAANRAWWYATRKDSPIVVYFLKTTTAVGYDYYSKTYREFSYLHRGCGPRSCNWTGFDFGHGRKLTAAQRARTGLTYDDNGMIVL